MAENRPRGFLEVLDASKTHQFQVPLKCINEGKDVDFWLTSWAYTDLMTFMLQLNAAMFPSKLADGSVKTWALGMGMEYSKEIVRLRRMIQELEDLIQEAPPDPGPRRFGNVSFRKWYALVEQKLDHLLDGCLPAQVVCFCSEGGEGTTTAKEELKAYLMGSFGSAQRLDYGTGHELSFIAFLGCIWKPGGFGGEEPKDQPFGSREREIVLGLIEPYLQLVRKLILTYTLEPAGSHGVWGLDDHSFVSYIFGSAQLSPAIGSPSEVPQEGSIPDAPRPSDVTKQSAVERERKTNMYFSAIGFIYDVKKGPFWEHSPMLFDISGVTAGWAKINKGMVKMYNAEVLSKFPVVQHFPFGSLFRWERNPAVPVPPPSQHQASQPKARVANMPPSSMPTTARLVPGAGAGTAAPWSGTPAHRTTAMPGPKSSWTGQAGETGLPATRAPWAGTTTTRPAPGASAVGTAAPWARPPGTGSAAAKQLTPVNEGKAPPR